MNEMNLLDEHELALSFALETDRNIFLTGRAGTGKTTLLKKIAEDASKNSVIAAPTGVAAIQAGGVTMHSLFHLPVTCFVPTNDFVDANLATSRRLLAGHLRFSREKKKVLQEMELLILDEASMIRADILDAVDYVCQLIRKKNQPFGGVQVMLIGDMHQLPPVTRDQDWKILKEYYTSPYFFDSMVWPKLDAVQIELKKIYRQQDQLFINLLNNIRDHRLESQDYEHLEKRYKPGYRTSEKGFVLLTTHNAKADRVNEFELGNLKDKVHSFTASIEGDFPESMYPCEKILNLKAEAQVMFIKNDVEDGNYFNGKLATVKSIEDDEVTVTFNDTGKDFVLVKETWENVHYSVEKSTNKIQKEALGTFIQYPLRLAWAITIHKSQGLTFDKVIVDAGQSFAAGQVYVALSRCRTLEGIVLQSRISQSLLYVDEKISAFTRAYHSVSDLNAWLSDAKINYADTMLKKVFAFNKILYRISEWKDVQTGLSGPQQESAENLSSELLKKAETVVSVADKFERQLTLLLNNPGNDPELADRCSKGIEYFTEVIYKDLILPVHSHIDELAFAKRVKKYVNFVQELEDECWTKIVHLYEARFLDKKLFAGERKYRQDNLKQISSGNTSRKKEKGSTYIDTLTLYKEGKSIHEIATIRSMAASTIKGHFAKWISAGEIDVNNVLPPEIVRQIEELLASSPGEVYTAFKAMPEKIFDYNDIRMVASQQNRLSSEKSDTRSN